MSLLKRFRKRNLERAGKGQLKQVKITVYQEIQA